MDMGRDILSDSAGTIYLTGNTASPDFPLTFDGHDARWTDGRYPSDAFVAALEPDGALRWSRTIGGPGYERAYAIERAADGDLVIAGRAGPGFPTTRESVQPVFGGDSQWRGPYGPQDGFVCRLSGDGQVVRFCTYLGTGDDGIIRDLALDGDGNVVVAMGSLRGDFPVGWFAGAFQPVPHGGGDIVVLKLARDGGTVLWATYLGGRAHELGAPSVAVAADGSVVVLLSTRSPDLPTPGGFDGTLGGEQDLYVARLSPGGDALLMGTYVGGSGVEAIETHGLALGPDGSIYVAGGTSSADLPTTPGSWLPVRPGDGNDGFLARISPEGRLLAATYVGGRGADYGEGLATDGAGRVYLTGYTESGDFGGAPGAEPGRDAGDLFVAVFDSSLGALRFATRIGGSGRDMGRAIAPAPEGWILATGQTASTDWPRQAGRAPVQPGDLDALVVRLRPRPR